MTREQDDAIAGRDAAADAGPDFETALCFTLQWEHAIWDETFVDELDDGDPPPDYSELRRQHGMPVQDVRDLSREEARRLYRAHYWEPMHCGAFGRSVSVVLFDSAVSAGVGRVTVWLERILGFEPDGGFGPMTLSAAKAFSAVHGEAALAEAILRRRRSYCENVAAPGRPLYPLRGVWLDRIDALERLLGLEKPD